jgi:putative two-component system response regulator
MSRLPVGDDHPAAAVAAQVRQLQEAVLFGLGRLTWYRDHDSERHLERVQSYTRILAERLAQHPELAAKLTPSYRARLEQSSILHDIGKCAIPDAILLKPGALTTAEYELMKSHTIVGREIIASIEARCGGQPFLGLARHIAGNHHERWDGKGYPAGLTGEAIPLSARLVALADVYDAVTVVRVYRPQAFTREEAARMVCASSGKLFDPRVAEAFAAAEAEFDGVRRRLAPAATLPPVAPAK